MWLAKWHSWADEGKFPRGFFIRSSLAGEAVGKLIVQLFRVPASAWHRIIFNWRGRSDVSWAAQMLCWRQSIMFCTWGLPWWRIRISELLSLVFHLKTTSPPWGKLIQSEQRHGAAYSFVAAVYLHVSLILNGKWNWPLLWGGIACLLGESCLWALQWQLCSEDRVSFVRVMRLT